MIQLGVCEHPDHASAIAEAGFDYLEINVQRELVPLEEEAIFAEIEKKLTSLPLPTPAANCLLPGSLPVVGPEVDPERIAAYLANAFSRAERVGVTTAVFGSGGARQVPHGFSRDDAWAQLIDFTTLASEIAETHGVTVVIEPLNRTECNILLSVKEGLALAQEVNQPHLQLLVDAYHWGREEEPAEDIVTAGSTIQHAHIAVPPSRVAPGVETSYDFGPFFGALEKIGYQGGLSVETKPGEAIPHLQVAHDFLREKTQALAGS